MAFLTDSMTKSIRKKLYILMKVNVTENKTFNLLMFSTSPQTNKKQQQTPSELTIPTEKLLLVGGVSVNFCGYGCRVVSAADS
jgi:hypothetical protein